MTPRVSVILPTYNRAAWVPYAVRSVLAQTLQDWELIVVNDGSTDETNDVLRSFADRRIRVIHQVNSGQAVATRVGIEHASAPYIAFLSDDDELTFDALSVMTQALDDPDVDAVYGDWVCEYVHAIFGGQPGQRMAMQAGPITDMPYRMVVVGCMFKRAMYDAIGGYPTRWQVAHDYAFWLTAYASGASIVHIPNQTYWYRYSELGNTFTRRELQLREDGEIKELCRQGQLDMRAVREGKRG